MLFDSLVWSFYNVVLPAALPISLVWGGLFLLGRRKPLFDIIGDGQLCFFSIALLAVTVNDIANLGEEKKRTPWAASYLRFAEPSSYMIIIITVFVFGLIVSLDGTANTPAIKRRLTQLPHFCFSRGRKGAEMLAFADADPNCGAKSPQIPAGL